MTSGARRGRFYSVLSAAIADLVEHGYDSRERLERWMLELRLSARDALIPEDVLTRTLRDRLSVVFGRATQASTLGRAHQGIPEFKLAQIKPSLHRELDRCVLASADLIKLNREASIHRVLQRFAGWASSVPVGGTQAVDRRKTGEEIRRSIARLPFEERRVIVDQSSKLVAAVNDIVARDGGAITATWRHIHPGPHYDSRPEHLARDGKLFVLRDNWALRDGLMKLAGHQYLDEVDQPGEKIYCSCTSVYGYTLRDLPADMLTTKGHAALDAARAA